MATGTVVETVVKPLGGGYTGSSSIVPAGPVEVQVAWTSNASGQVTQTMTSQLAGFIVGVDYVPTTGGTVPTASHTITLVHSAGGYDLLSGTGAALPSSGTTSKAPGIVLTDGTNSAPMPRAVVNTPTFVVNGAGNAKAGTTYLTIRPLEKQ